MAPQRALKVEPILDGEDWTCEYCGELLPHTFIACIETLKQRLAESESNAIE